MQVRNNLISLSPASSMSGISRGHLCDQLIVCQRPSALAGGHLGGSFHVKRSRLVMVHAGRTAPKTGP